MRFPRRREADTPPSPEQARALASRASRPATAEAERPAPAAARPGERVTWRGPVVGLLACALLGALVPHVVLVAHNTDPEMGYLPFGALVPLLLLARVWGPWA